MSSKMTTTLQKLLTILCQKSQNCAYLGPYDFVNLTSAFGPNIHQIMYGETLDLRRDLDLQCQHQQW